MSAIRAGRAFVELFADDSKLHRGLKSAEKSLRSFAAKAATVSAGFAGAGAAILAPIAAAAKGFASAGDAVDKMAGRTGISAETLSAMSFAAEQSGASLDEFEKGVRGMQKTLLNAERGLSTATDSLGELGLSVDDLQGKSPVEQFSMLADAVSRVEDPSRRAALAMQVFGKSGSTLLPLMAGGAAGIKALTDEASALGFVLGEKDSKAAAAFTDAMNRVKRTLGGVAMQIGAAVAPVMTDLSGRIAGVVTKVTEFIGENREMVVYAAAVGAALVGVATALTAIAGVATAASVALGAVTTVMAAASAVAGVLLGPAGLIVAGAVAVGVLVEKFVGWGNVLDAVGGYVTSFVDGAMALLEAAPLLVERAWESMTTALRETWEGVSVYLTGDATSLSETMAGLWEKVRTAFESMASSVRAAWDSTIGAITSKVTDLQNKLASGVFADVFAEIYGVNADDIRAELNDPNRRDGTPLKSSHFDPNYEDPDPMAVAAGAAATVAEKAAAAGPANDAGKSADVFGGLLGYAAKQARELGETASEAAKSGRDALNDAAMTYGSPAGMVNEMLDRVRATLDERSPINRRHAEEIRSVGTSSFMASRMFGPDKEELNVHKDIRETLKRIERKKPQAVIM